MARGIAGKRELLKDKLPMSPVSVDVLSMLSTPALARVSFGAWAIGCERMEREAPVTTETLLALLLRPEMLETGSVTGIVPPARGVLSQASVRPRFAYPSELRCAMRTGTTNEGAKR